MQCTINTVTEAWRALLCQVPSLCIIFVLFYPSVSSGLFILRGEIIHGQGTPMLPQ